MSVLAQLKLAIACFHEKQVSELIITENNVTIDLILQAINNARTWAIKEHDFNLLRTRANLSVNVKNGGNFSDMKLVTDPTKSVFPLKIISGRMRVGTGATIPLDLVTQQYVDDVEERRFGADYVYYSARNTGRNLRYITNSGLPTCVLLPDHVYMLPFLPGANYYDATGNINLVFSLYPKLDPITDATPDTDFFLDYGYEFALWRSICELNVLTRQFVPRQEGNISPPDDKASAAWDSLVKYDENFLVTEDGFDLE